MVKNKLHNINNVILVKKPRWFNTIRAFSNVGKGEASKHVEQVLNVTSS